MKLLYCSSCKDIVNLIQGADRKCYCGASSGRYVNQLDAVLRGPCVPLGIGNSSLMRAMIACPPRGRGEVFDAFVIPKDCQSVCKGGV